MDGCLLWGQRVITPQKFQEMLLPELHVNHIGMSRMKALARSYTWWPWLNSDIEETCRKCNECSLLSDNPIAALLRPWLVPKQPLKRIHIDYATMKENLGVSNNRCFFQMARSLSSKFTFGTVDHSRHICNPWNSHHCSITKWTSICFCRIQTFHGCQ